MDHHGKALQQIVDALGFLVAAAWFLVLVRREPMLGLAVLPLIGLMALPLAGDAMAAWREAAMAAETEAYRGLAGMQRSRQQIADWVLSDGELARFWESERRRWLPTGCIAAGLGGLVVALVLLPMVGPLALPVAPALALVAMTRLLRAVSRYKWQRMARHGGRVCIGRRGAYVGGHFIHWWAADQADGCLIEAVMLRWGPVPVLSVVFRSGRSVRACRLPVSPQRRVEAERVARHLAGAIVPGDDRRVVWF